MSGFTPDERDQLGEVLASMRSVRESVERYAYSLVATPTPTRRVTGRWYLLCNAAAVVGWFAAGALFGWLRGPL